jgi:hypothetical protein
VGRCVRPAVADEDRRRHLTCRRSHMSATIAQHAAPPGAVRTGVRTPRQSSLLNICRRMSRACVM